MADDGRLWHNLDSEECASAVKGVCDSLERTQGPRRMRMRRNISLYEGRPLDGLNPEAYFSASELGGDDFDVLRVNLARGLVHTAVAKVAGKQKPKTQFVVNDGDWTVKRKAKKMERFVEAHMLQRQGNCTDAWEQGLKAMRDCCVADLGVLTFESNLAEERIDIYRSFGFQFLVDPLDAQNGEPQSLFRVYPYDRFKLLARFPKHEAAIMTAKDATAEPLGGDLYTSVKGESSMILVRQGWRLPASSNKPGRHVLVAGSTDLCDGEDWTARFFPHEFFVWEEWMQGMYGTSVVDNVYHLVHELNAAIQRMSDAERYGSNQMVFYEENSVAVEKLESNIAKTMIPVSKAAANLPTVTTPNAISQSSVNWFNTLKGLGYEVPGISQMAATGQKDAGVDAAVAMRTIESIATERFAIPWQMYERRMSVGAARQILRCAREIGTKVKNYAAKWPNGGFLQEIKLEDVDLEEDQYQIQPYAVSGLVNTPADRLSLASELMDRQILSPDGYLRVIQAKDIDSELSRTNTWAQLIEKYIESWLDATKESEEAGAEGDPKGFLYRPPIKWMPLPEVILQVGRAYADAELNGAPDYNLQFFIRFMKDADRMIAEIEAQKAQMAAVASGATAGAMPAEAPPAADMAAPPPPGVVMQ